MASTTDTLNIIITSKAKGDGAKKTEKGLKDIVKAAKAFAAAAAASQIVKYTVELTKLGLEADRQATSLDNLADAAGHSGDAITDAIQEASQHTIDRMSAMQAANRAMVMDVAKSPKEFERLTKVAVALGRAMGQDAAKSIDDFVTASARQSQMIADNLGLTVTVGQATERYAAALGITTDQLTDAQKKQAFLNMMLEEGEKKMAELGETTLDGAAKAEQASAAWKDTKTALGQTFAALAQSSGALDFMSAFAREVQAVAEHGLSLSASFAGVRALFSGGGLTGAMEAHRAALEGINSETDSAIRSYQAMARAADEPTRALSSLSFVSDEVKQKLQSQVTTQGMLERTILNTADVIRREAIGSNEELMRTVLAASEALEGEASAMGTVEGAAQSMGEAQLGIAAQYANYQQDITESAEDFAERREKIEQEHQDKLAELAKRGQARAVKVDVAAEEEKLAALQRKLEIALQQEAEFTGKTKASTRMRKEDQIAALQDQISEQAQLLDDYHAGRLVTTGSNVDDLIAEENRQYEASLAGLEASQAKQEEAQRQSLGRMVLQHFNAWVEMNVAADGYTEEEKAYVARMREDINREYGLITDAAITEMNEQESKWRTTMSQMAGSSSAFFDEFTRRFNALPSEHVVKIRYDMATPQTEEGRLGGESQALGTGFSMGGMTLVGERGPELVTLPRGAGVFTAGQTRQMMRGGGMGGGTVNIGPVYITGEAPEVIWRKLERYARIKGKSGWRQLGR